MTPEQFAYWLQGFTEVAKSVPNSAQWKIIQDHLNTVFHKVTPSYINPNVPQIPNWNTPGQVGPVLTTLEKSVSIC